MVLHHHWRHIHLKPRYGGLEQLAQLLNHPRPEIIPSSIQSVDIRVDRQRGRMDFNTEHVNMLVQLLGMLPSLHTIKIVIESSFNECIKNDNDMVRRTLATLPNLRYVTLGATRQSTHFDSHLRHLELDSILACHPLRLLDLTGLEHVYYSITAATLALQPMLWELRLSCLFKNDDVCMLDFIVDAGLHRLRTLIVDMSPYRKVFTFYQDNETRRARVLPSLKRFVHACPTLNHLTIRTGQVAHVDPWGFLRLVSQLLNLRTLAIFSDMFDKEMPVPAAPMIFPLLTKLRILAQELVGISDLSATRPSIPLYAGLCATYWPRLQHFTGSMRANYWQPADVTKLLQNAPRLKDLRLNGIELNVDADRTLQAICEAGPLILTFLQLDISSSRSYDPYYKTKFMDHVRAVQQACPLAYIHLLFRDRCCMVPLNLTGTYKEWITPVCTSTSQHHTHD
jgi:hypothetical protein